MKKPQSVFLFTKVSELKPNKLLLCIFLDGTGCVLFFFMDCSTVEIKPKGLYQTLILPQRQVPIILKADCLQISVTIILAIKIHKKQNFTMECKKV